MFVPRVIGKCCQGALLKPVGCSLRAQGWKTIHTKDWQHQFALQGDRKPFREPRTILSYNGTVLCKAQDICCVLGHLFNPKDSSAWQESLIYKGTCSACTVPAPGERDTAVWELGILEDPKMDCHTQGKNKGCISPLEKGNAY